MELRIELREWLEHDVLDPTEAASLAEIAIFAGDICITEIEDSFSRTTRQTIRISASALATWLLENFWRLRFETSKEGALKSDLGWEMAHRLPAIGEGYLWPPLTFVGTDGEFSILSLERTPVSEVIHSARYLNNFIGPVTTNSLEVAIFGFVETVQARLADLGFKHSPVQQLLQEVNEERANAKSIKFRMLEGLLGLDPDDDVKLVNSVMNKWAKKVGISAVEEISAAAGRLNVENILKQTESAARLLKRHGRSSMIDQVRSSLTSVDPFAPTWLKAKDAAYKTREIWNLGDRPVSESLLSESLGLTERELSAYDVKLPFSFAVVDVQNDRFGFALARERRESRRFDTARLLGDQLFIDSKELIKPATAATTTRQKYQRAFAAEFLCPSKIIRERCESASSADDLEHRLDRLAVEYQVDDRIVRNHWVNHGEPYSMSAN